MKYAKLFKAFLAAAMLFTTIDVRAIEPKAEELMNVATGGQAVANQVSGEFDGKWNANYVNDGDVSLNGYWDSGSNPDGTATVVLDLMKEYEVKEIKIYHYWDGIWPTNAPRWYQYEIYTSIDGNNWNLVAEKKDEQFVSREGNCYVIDNPTKIRYVKVISTGSNIDDNKTHIVELETYAPIEKTKPNIALNKPVEATQGDASLITDGNKNTYWDGGLGPQSFVIDLEDYYKLSSLKAFPYYLDNRYYEYEIYTSDNGYQWSKIAEKKDNTPETSIGDEFLIEEEIISRYIQVKMFKNSVNDYVHMNEFEVYGELQEGYVPSIPVDPDDKENIAFAKNTRANMGKNFSKWAVDGNVNTEWNAFTFPSSLDVDLEKTYQLKDMTLYFPYSENKYYMYSVYTSLDGVHYERLIQKRNHEVVDFDGDTYQIENKEARYVRINVEFASSGYTAGLSEIKIHGDESNIISSKREYLDFVPFDQSEYSKPITEQETITEVFALIGRVLGNDYKDWFEFELDNDSDIDFFEISNTADGKILIRGNAGVSLTSGLYHYLKQYCHVQITQQTKQLDTMPNHVIPVSSTIYKSTPFSVRYAYNYCTLSYTNAFYGEDEWQRELDWLALNGVNVVLDTTGQEAVWIDFLDKIGYSIDDAEAWLVGPAYTAWQYMSNMENFGGPINDDYIIDRLELARKNQRKMRVLGISPVMQGYAGMIPSDYEKVVEDKEKYQEYIDATVYQGVWANVFTRPNMLDTRTEAFSKAADLFYESQKKLLGDVTDYYAIDPFHEGGIRPDGISDSEISKLVLEKMMSNDENAVWMIQAWQGNPTRGLLEGLGENKNEHALILDLTSTTDPHYDDTNLGVEFNGTPWVYCMLDNYGDRPGVHGELEVIASQVYNASQNSQHMKGIGITAEGTKVNPVNYELFFETVWKDEEIDVTEWLKSYIENRYGTYSESAYQGWLNLLDSAYGAKGFHWGSPNAIANWRPGQNPVLGDVNYIPYSTKIFDAGVEKILADYDLLSHNESYLYDVAALLQQQLQNAQLVYYKNFEQAYKESNVEEFDKNAQLFLDSISVLDEVVATQTDGLLGNWIGLANDRAQNYDDFSKDIFEFNAKALITTWAGRAGVDSLGDYAYRQYSGLQNDYVKPRWEKYIECKRNALINGEEYREVPIQEYFNDTWNFILSNKEYTRKTTNAQNEIKRLSELVFDKYIINTDKVVKDDNIAINGFPTGDKAIDNNDDTLWIASSNDLPSVFELNLVKNYPVYRIQTVFEKGPALAGRYMGFEISILKNGIWETVLVSDTSKNNQNFNIIFEQPEMIQKVRVTITSLPDDLLWPAIAELRVFSSKGIQILDDNIIERVNNSFVIEEEMTVSQLLEKLHADVGEIQFFKEGILLNENDIVTKDSQITLTASTVVVDSVSVIQKKELKDLIVSVQELIEENYTTASWKTMQIVLEKAMKVYENKEALQKEIDDVTKELINAFSTLERIYVVKVSGEEVYQGVYNEKVTLTAPVVEGQTFTAWLWNGKVISTDETYTFFLSDDMEFTPCYEAVEMKAEALLTNTILTKREDTKADIKFVAQLVVPTGYTVKDAGLVWSSKEDTVLDLTNAKATYITRISTTNQFSVTIKGMPKGKFIRGRIFATLVDDEGNETVVYSDETRVVNK